MQMSSSNNNSNSYADQHPPVPEEVPLPVPPVIVIDSDDEGQKGDPKLTDDEPDFEDYAEPKKGEGRKRKPKAKAAPKRKAKMQKVEHFSIELPPGECVFLTVNGRPYMIDCDPDSEDVHVVKLTPAFRG